MVKRKKIRERGKISFSEAFKELSPGDKVSISKERAMASNFPDRIQGRTGIVKEARGKAYVVEVKDFNKSKEHIIEPIHLRKIKQ